MTNTAMMTGCSRPATVSYRAAEADRTVTALERHCGWLGPGAGSERAGVALRSRIVELYDDAVGWAAPRLHLQHEVSARSTRPLGVAAWA